MTRTHEYLIRRHGSNAANQPMTPVMPVAIVRAASRQEAERLSWHGETPSVHSAPSLASEIVLGDDAMFYANQSAEAVPLSRARQSEIDELDQRDAMADLLVDDEV